MKTIYEDVVEKVYQGARCTVDFKKRTLKLNNKLYPLNAKELGIGGYKNLDDWLDKVEDLYDDYKYSTPTQQSIQKERKSKFKALSVSELIDTCGHDALSNPMQRNVAQAKLEVFILLSLIGGAFDPNELFAKDWFYQGADKSLIIRKDWF